MGSPFRKAPHQSSEGSRPADTRTESTRSPTTGVRATMFSWLRRSSRPSAAIQATEVSRIVGEYGRLMENYPTAFLDASRLPSHKERMKKALKVAWISDADPTFRGAIEQAYLHLCHFQEGIGEVPMDPALPVEPDPHKSLEVLVPYLKISERVRAEEQLLASDFDAFKKNPSLHGQ